MTVECNVFCPAPKHMIWLSVDYRHDSKIPIWLWKSLVGDTPSSYALKCLVLHILSPISLFAILLWRKWEHRCTWINRDVFAQNLAFLRVVPLISRPNVHFNRLWRNHDSKWADGIIRLCALSYLPSSRVYKKDWNCKKCSKFGSL